MQGIPNSCCISNQSEEECVKSGAGSSVHPQGCYDKLQEKLHMHSKVLIGVGIGIAFVEVNTININYKTIYVLAFLCKQINTHQLHYVVFVPDYTYKQ